MRRIQLLISLYNGGFAYIHFAWKVLGLSCAIINISIGIALDHGDNFQLAMSYIFFGMETILFYCVLFHKAFSVPMVVKKLKKEMVSFVKHNVTDEDEKKILCRVIRSIPLVGIRVGEFHNFERMSTPNFMAFVVKNVTRVLIGIRNKNH